MYGQAIQFQDEIADEFPIAKRPQGFWLRILHAIFIRPIFDLKWPAKFIVLYGIGWLLYGVVVILIVAPLISDEAYINFMAWGKGHREWFLGPFRYYWIGMSIVWSLHWTYRGLRGIMGLPGLTVFMWAFIYVNITSGLWAYCVGAEWWNDNVVLYQWTGLELDGKIRGYTGDLPNGPIDGPNDKYYVDIDKWKEEKLVELEKRNEEAQKFDKELEKDFKELFESTSS